MQEGRNIEICNSFELLVNTVDGKTTHDAEYFIAKEKQCTHTSNPLYHACGYDKVPFQSSRCLQQWNFWAGTVLGMFPPKRIRTFTNRYELGLFSNSPLSIVIARTFMIIVSQLRGFIGAMFLFTRIIFTFKMKLAVHLW